MTVEILNYTSIKIGGDKTILCQGVVDDFSAKLIVDVVNSYEASFSHIGNEDYVPLVESIQTLLADGYLPLTAVAGITKKGVYTSKLQIVNSKGRHDLMKLFMPNPDGTDMTLHFYASDGWNKLEGKTFRGLRTFGKGLYNLVDLWKRYSPVPMSFESVGNVIFAKMQ